MARVLIPFAEPESASRAIGQLLAQPRDGSLSVHLLAAVEPRVSGKVGILVSPQQAEAQVRAAAARWLARLENTLASAGGPCTSETVLGPPRAVIRHAATRADVDRVLLPTSGGAWRRERERRHAMRHTPHPVTIVG